MIDIILWSVIFALVVSAAFAVGDRVLRIDYSNHVSRYIEREQARLRYQISSPDPSFLQPLSTSIARPRLGDVVLVLDDHLDPSSGGKRCRVVLVIETSGSVLDLPATDPRIKKLEEP